MKLLFGALFCAILLGSCVSHDELRYFRKEGTARAIPKTEIANQVAFTIQRSDVLSVTVHSFDQENAAPFNLVDNRAATNAGGNNASPFATYLVDEAGNIDLPVLGKINVLGLTINEAKMRIVDQLKKHLKDPVVNMRLVNFRVTVLGEVNRPGTFTIDNDRITILEAIGMAGDMTPYSNRQNVFIVREQNGIRESGEVDIQSTEFLKSPYFFLRQGDVVYVEPRKDKEATVRDQFTEYIPWITAALQTVTTVVTLIVLLGNK